MKRNTAKDTGLLAFTALYSVLMICLLAATVIILSLKKEDAHAPHYVVETEYVYVTEFLSEEESVYVSEETAAVAASADEILLVKEYLGKIGIFNTEGEAIYIIDTYTKTLPEADRHLLKEGFEIIGQSELAAIIQDYSS